MIETLPPVAVPVEPTTPIRPSEALRLGRLRYPVPVEGLLYGVGGAACAVGAMAVGFGLPVPVTEDDAEALYAAVGDHLSESADPCPVCGRRSFGMSPEETVWHLNDSHSWSDSQFVAWLESLGL